MSGKAAVKMEELLKLTRRMAPDLTEEWIKRYRILKTIRLLEPVGRRMVAVSIGMPERTVRGEIDKLSIQKLIDVSKIGMVVTQDGHTVLKGLEPLFLALTGISALEDKMAQLLGVEKVLIAQGNCDENENVKKEMGRLAVSAMLSQIEEHSKIAVTGGTCLAAFVEAMPHFSGKKAELVVPARGSIGRKNEVQADTLAVKLAEKLGADYRLLHLPDTLSQKALDEMKQDPEIKDTIEEMHQAKTLIFGVGNGLEMAEKRHVDEQTYLKLKQQQVVAEACGYYFNAAGDVVHVSRCIGIDFHDIGSMNCVIAIAGGKRKADCILAVSKRMQKGVIVMDEGAATAVLEQVESNFSA